jgi:hypothetical protein
MAKRKTVWRQGVLLAVVLGLSFSGPAVGSNQPANTPVDPSQYKVLVSPGIGNLGISVNQNPAGWKATNSSASAPTAPSGSSGTCTFNRVSLCGVSIPIRGSTPVYGVLYLNMPAPFVSDPFVVQCVSNGTSPTPSYEILSAVAVSCRTIEPVTNSAGSIGAVNATQPSQAPDSAVSTESVNTDPTAQVPADGPASSASPNTDQPSQSPVQ